MSPAETAFLRRLRRRARDLAPDLARRELATYEMIRQSLTDAELARAIESGQLDRLILEVLSDERLEPSVARLRARVDQMLVSATRAEAVHGLPSPLAARAFGILNPLLVQAARTLNTRVVEGLKNEVRETVMQAAEDGLREGVNPRTVARRIKSSIGLPPRYEAAVANFQRELATGDGAALTRKLRDRRFDRTIARAFSGEGLSRDQIERMTAAYRRRMIAFNAETHARTLALDAQKLAQRLAWEDAIRRGVVNRNDLVRTWLTVGDDRVRPEHAAMNGRRVTFDERFMVPYPGGTVEELTPGESTFNCRCQARVTLRQQTRRAA